MQDQDKARQQMIDELTEMRSSKIEVERTAIKSGVPKPDLPDNVLTQWQGIVDLMAIVCRVPAGLIMKIHPSEIEVLISAKTRDNPYHPGEKASLKTGLYCETVLGTRERLLVPNALKDPYWDHNPDIPLGMISYLGYPLLWPDGDVFGTICILDNKENSYSVQVAEYVKLFRGNIENYLALLFEVNEYNQAEEALRSTLDRFYTILSSLYGGVLLVTNDGVVEFANEAFCDLFDLRDSPGELHSLKDSEMLGKIREVYANPDEAVARIMEIVAENRSVKSEEIAMVGGRTYMRDFIPVVVNEKPHGRFWYHTDITDRKRMDDAVRKAEDRYRNVSSITSDIAYSCSKSTKTSYSIDWITGATERVTGYSGDEIKALGCWKTLILDDDLPVFDKHVIGVAPGMTDSCQLRLRHKTGKMVWVHSSTKCVFDSGSPDSLRLYGGIVNITDQKMTLELLSESEERFRVAAECASDDIYEWYVSTDQVNHYGKIYETLGYTGDELPKTSKAWADLIHPEDRGQVISAVERFLRSEEQFLDMEYRILRKDGTFSHFVDRGAALRDQHGNPYKWIGVISDMTGRKESEEKSLRLSAIVDSSDDAIIGKTLDGIITSWNKGAEKIYGFKEYEVVGRPISILDPHDRQDELQFLLEQVKSGKPVKHLETVRRNRDGTNIPVSLTISPIISKESGLIGVSTIARDISDRVKVEQEKQALQTQLFQSQKLEALGTLVGGIAHDFNNMLQIMIGYSQLLLDDKKKGEPGYSDLQTVIETGQGGADLVKKLLAFGQQGQVFPVSLNLNQQIRDLTTIISRTLPQVVQIDLDLADGPTTIRADHNQIDQLVMNLAINASEAMPNGGRLKIATATVKLDDHYCGSHHGAKPGNYVMLSVTDTGRGIDKETLAKIFDPFFSTKERGSTRGTGLGLSVVRGIAQQQGGHVTCESEQGKGTEFKVYFPAIEAPQITAKTIEPSVKSERIETILVVEDNIPVSELEQKALENAGYKVVVATRGQEALDIYRSRQDEISLVILDLLMPGMSGRDCLMELLKIDPSVKVLIASGYAPEDELHREISPLVKGFVHKPFAITELQNEARLALDGD